MESYQTSHGNDHGRARSRDSGDAAGGPQAGIAGLSVDSGCHSDVPGDAGTCLGCAEQGSKRFRSSESMAQDVLVVTGLPVHLRRDGRVVDRDSQLAADPFLSSGAALWRMAPSDLLINAARWVGGERPRSSTEYPYGGTEPGISFSLFQYELSH